MRAIYFAFVLLAAACGAPVDNAGEPTRAAATASATLEVRNGWTRPTPGGVNVSSGYLTIVNGTDAADRLLAASSPRAARTEVHEMAMEGGVMRMRAVEGGLAAPAGETVTLAPGGLHIMFFGVGRPFAEGETIPLTLTFERAGQIETTLAVRAGGASRAGR